MHAPRGNEIRKVKTDAGDDEGRTQPEC